MTTANKHMHRHPIRRKIRLFLYGMIKEFIDEDLKELDQRIRKNCRPQFNKSDFSALRRYASMLHGHGINKEKVGSEISLATKVGVSGEDKDGGIVVSLTSYPARLYDVHYTIHSLLSQTMRPEKVVLWLGEEKFPQRENDVPSAIRKLEERGLEIKFCHDRRSFTKLLPALESFPEKTIVTADDDIYYDRDWLEKLVTASKQNPSSIWAVRARKVSLCETGLSKYESWPIMREGSPPCFCHFLTGVGGVLYPPNALFQPLVFNEAEFQTLTPLGDDIWFWAMALLNNTKIGVVDGFPGTLTYVNKMREYGFSDDGRLYALNKGEEMNDAQINAVLGRFPELLEKLRNEISADN